MRESALARIGVRLIALLAVAAAILPAVATAYSAPPAGVLTQLQGTSGCVLQPAADGCAGGFALNAAVTVAISPNGDSVYVGSSGGETIAVFDRAQSSGTLTQKPAPDGCVSADGSGGCPAVTALADVTDIEVSPDGTSLYATSFFSSSLVVFDRDPSTGAITQKPGPAGCIVPQQPRGGPCTEARAVTGASTVALSPDGTSLYLVPGIGEGALAVFDRDPATGALTQKPGTAGCIARNGAEGCADSGGLLAGTTVDVAPDGASVYATYGINNALAVLDRAPNGEVAFKPGVQRCVSEDGDFGCANGRALQFVTDVDVSSDGENVYATAYDGSPAYAGATIAVFDRDPSGALTQKTGQAGCVSDDGSGGSCTDVRGLHRIVETSLGPSGTSLYTAGRAESLESSVGRFSRNLTTGALSQASTPSGCLADTGFGGLCLDVRGLDGASGIAASPDNGSVYVAAQSADGVAAFKRSRGKYTFSSSCHVHDVPTVIGGSADDTLRGTRGADVIAGMGGRDTIRSLGGDDVVCSGNGADRVLGGSGADLLVGDAGEDRLNGGGADDRCVGGSGRDRRDSC